MSGDRYFITDQTEPESRREYLLSPMQVQASSLETLPRPFRGTTPEGRATGVSCLFYNLTGIETLRPKVLWGTLNIFGARRVGYGTVCGAYDGKVLNYKTARHEKANHIYPDPGTSHGRITHILYYSALPAEGA